MEKLPENFTHEFKDINSSPVLLPIDVQHEIRHYSVQNFTLDKWEFNPVKRNEIILYAHDIRNENAINKLQGKQIGNYTIRIIHDTEFETTRAEIEEYLAQLRKNPDYQIAGISMVTNPFENPTGHYAELWCYSSTPENKKLDNTMIKGWKIFVYPLPPLPKNSPPNSSSSTASS